MSEKLAEAVERLKDGPPFNGEDVMALLDSWKQRGEEIARLDFLHKNDHSLADQWLARAEKAEVELAAALDDRLHWRGLFYKAEAELESWKAANLYPHEYRMAVEELVRLKAELAAAQEDRDRFQAYVHAVQPVIDPAALGLSVEQYREVVYRMRDQLAAAQAEAERLGNEHAQCHKWNGDLVHEHYELKRQLAAANERAEKAEAERDEMRQLLTACVRQWDNRTAGVHYTADGEMTVFEAAREALRSTPACHCTGDGHKPDCAFWVSLATPAAPDKNIECAGGHDGLGCGLECAVPPEEPLPLGHPFKPCSTPREHLTDVSVEIDGCHHWDGWHFCDQPKSAHLPKGAK